jgi:hypothetical protein
MVRIKKRITNFDFVAEVLDNIDKDPNQTVLHVLPYSYGHTLFTDAVLEQILIIYKDES